MEKINSLYNCLDNDDINLIYDRLGYDKDNLVSDKKSKILTIESIYKTDKDILGYLLTSNEIRFLNENLDKKVGLSSFVYNLNSLGIMLKDSDGFYSVPLELKSAFKRSIELYNKEFKQIEDTKIIIYFILGLIRIKGALRKDDLLDILKSFSQITDELFDVCLTHPLFKRFLMVDYRNKKEYITFKEFKNVNYDFYKYYNKNVDYDKQEIFSIGLNVFDVNNDEFNKLLDYPRVCYVLGQINKNEAILFIGNNNYDYTNFIDKSLFEMLDDEEINVLDDYFRTLPSFVDVSKTSLFINPTLSKSIDSIVSLLYKHSQDFYNKVLNYEELTSDDNLDSHIRKLQLTMLENNFSVVDEMIETYDLSETEEKFLLDLKNNKEEEYAVLKCTKNGLEIINTHTLKTYIVKLELNNYYRDHKLVPHLARICLCMYDDTLLMFTYAPGRNLMDDEKTKYLDIFKKSLPKRSL